MGCLDMLKERISPIGPAVGNSGCPAQVTASPVARRKINFGRSVVDEIVTIRRNKFSCCCYSSWVGLLYRSWLWFSIWN